MKIGILLKIVGFIVVMVAIISTNGDWIPVLVSAYYYGDYGNGVFG